MNDASRRSENGRHAKLVSRLWEAMVELFGPLWVSSAGPTPSRAWRAGLDLLTDAEIEHGMRAVLTDWDSKFPPTWPEFRTLARPPDRRTPEQRARDARIAIEDRRETYALPSPEQLAAASPTGRRWLAFEIVEGHRPMPPDTTMDDCADALEGADVAAMRARVASGRAEILRRMGAEEWAR